ncbi:hypothetical protein MPSEU_000918900 [Mayamaea pseudoterrestris]|nr:hypothetical protein MPSEU_000918900 [Mayamaea pseudoterrestris]
MTSPVTVHLLITSDEDALYAKQVSEILDERFKIRRVLVRSADAPFGRLVEDTPLACLYVVLGESTLIIAALEREIPHPVIKLSLTKNAFETALTIAKHCSLAGGNLCTVVSDAVRQQHQARLVKDAQHKTQSHYYMSNIHRVIDGHTQITGDSVTMDGCMRGKVRDRYVGETTMALVTTDRQSGFDRHLAHVPFKGAVLNLTSAYWFDATKHIIANHLLNVPHPYVSIVRKCKPFPIEFVVRAYMTGSTSTSIWKNYESGVRNYCGHTLVDGMIKNQKLNHVILTPTTKEEEHDRPISLVDIVKENWMSQEDLDVCAEAALKVFALGQSVASERGLILVDTKFEFGRDVATGEILLIDEVLTPDSSRYWLGSTYEERISEGLEPDNIDKEFLRLWFRDNCDPYDTNVELPEAPRELVVELARRYITLYEMITWKTFDFDAVEGESAISAAIQKHLS